MFLSYLSFVFVFFGPHTHSLTLTRSDAPAVFEHLCWLWRFSVDTSIAWMWFLFQRWRMSQKKPSERRKSHAEKPAAYLNALWPNHFWLFIYLLALSHNNKAHLPHQNLRNHFTHPFLSGLRLLISIIMQHYYVTCYLSHAFFLSCLETFSLGLGGARQFPGFVRILV